MAGPIPKSEQPGSPNGSPSGKGPQGQGNMSIIQEGGKVASGVVDAMKSQPLVLALIIFNVVFLVLIYLGLNNQRNQQHDLMKMMLSNQQNVNELLAKCIVPSELHDKRSEIPPPQEASREVPH